MGCEPLDTDGFVQRCVGPLATTFTIDDLYDGDYQFFSDNRAITVFNAGVIHSASFSALELLGTDITYLSDGAVLRSGQDAGMRAHAFDMDLGISGVVGGFIGLDLYADEATDQVLTSSIDVRLENASVVGAWAGISIHQGAEDIASILVDDASSLWVTDQQAAAITVGAGTTQITLAGSVLGPLQTSYLAEGDDLLELHPHFTFEGQIDAGGGTNTLSFGGTGSDSFDLGALGRALDPSDPQPSYLSFSRFSKTGSSAWTLTGDATQRFDLDIASGTVVFDGDVRANGGAFMLGEDARLGGTGHLDTLDVWGTLAPGNAVGTLYAEDVVFHAGSLFEIETTATAADRLDVGSADLSGATLRVVPSAGSAGSYEIVRSETTLVGRFTDVQSVSPRYQPTLRYIDALGADAIDATGVMLDLAATGTSFSSYAKTPQQAAVAALLDALGENAPYYAQLDVMSPEDAALLLEQMSGSDFAATTAALLQNTSSLSTASLGRIQQQAGALGPASAVMGFAEFSADEWTDGLYPSVWGRLIAGTSTIGGSTSGSAALIGGADVRLGDDLTLGLLAGMGSSSIVQGNTATSSVDLSAGVYGAKEFGGLALRFGASLTHHDVDSARTVSAPGVNETLTASYGALSAQLYAELAQEFDLGPVGVELFGDLVYSRHFSPGFTEAGGAGALTVAASSSDAVDTTVGLRASHQVAWGTKLLTTGLMAGWKHRFAATPSTINSLAGSAPFEVPGLSTAGSALVAGADIRLDLDERSGLDVAYNFEWSATGVAHAISARYAKLF